MKRKPGFLSFLKTCFIPADKSGGFTLLEILVAITILAVAFSSIFRLFGGTLRTIENGEKYAHAAVLGQERLNMFLLDPYPPEPGSGSGVFSDNPGYRWNIAVELFAEPLEPEESINAGTAIYPVTYKAVISVGWNEGTKPKSLELTALKTVLEEGE